MRLSDTDPVESAEASPGGKRVRLLLGKSSGREASSLLAEKGPELEDGRDPQTEVDPPGDEPRSSPIFPAQRKRIVKILKRSGNPHPTWENVSEDVLVELGLRSPSRGGGSATPDDNLPDLPESWRITPPLPPYGELGGPTATSYGEFGGLTEANSCFGIRACITGCYTRSRRGSRQHRIKRRTPCWAGRWRARGRGRRPDFVRAGNRLVGRQ